MSLTVNEVDGNRFGVNLIPHTLRVTTLHSYRGDTAVNLEVDIIARYVERIAAGSAVMSAAPGIKLNSIDEVLADIRAGRMVVIIDDEDRENEGDLVMAAEFATSPRHQFHGEVRAAA